MLLSICQDSLELLALGISPELIDGKDLREGGRPGIPDILHPAEHRGWGQAGMARHRGNILCVPQQMDRIEPESGCCAAVLSQKWEWLIKPFVTARTSVTALTVMQVGMFTHDRYIADHGNAVIVDLIRQCMTGRTRLWFSF